MPNLDRHLGFWISIASNGLALAIMAAPIYFPTLPAGIFFVGGVLVFLVGAFIVVFLLLREARHTGSAERRSMVGPIVVMIVGTLAFCSGAIWFYMRLPPGQLAAEIKEAGGIGGKGGGGTIEGDNGTIIGGRGGDGGPSTGGLGGEGGSGYIKGSGGIIVGGGGGNVGQRDGRGGKPPRSASEVAGLPTDMWKLGRGGAGANSPEYNRRLALLIKIRTEYTEAFPDMAPYISSGIDQVPLSWVNKRLEEMGEQWRVTGIDEDGGYKMPPITKPSGQTADEGAQGVVGGIGGGKGVSGEPGGPGAIIISYVPASLEKAPETLYQNYQIDAYAEGFAGRTELVSSGPNGTTKEEIHLAWGAGCGPTTLWLYIPESKYVYEQSEQFLTVYRQMLSKLDMQRKIPSKSGCTAAPASSAETRFSKKVYIYSETDLPQGKVKLLIDAYTKNQLVLEFRSASYLTTRRQRWASEKRKQPKEVVVMMVGDDAPL